MTFISRKSFAASNLLLFSFYTISCLEYRSWMFALALAVQELGGLRLVSIKQFAESIFIIICSGYLGRYFDRCTRRQGITSAILLSDVSLCLSGILLAICMSFQETSHTILYTVFLLVGLLMSGVNHLGNSGEKTLIGKDWIVLIADTSNLAELNAILTLLDQFTNVISPIFAAYLLTKFGIWFSMVIFGFGAVLLLIIKYLLASRLLATEPRLRFRKEAISKSKAETSSARNEGYAHLLSMYFKQIVFWAALGLALLYMTVLAFDGLAIGYGQSSGLPKSVLGLFGSTASAMGIMGALSYAFLAKTFGVRRTGCFGFMFQSAFLFLTVISIWLPGSPEDISSYFSTITGEQWWSDFKSLFTPKATNSSEVIEHIDWDSFSSNGHSLWSIMAFLVGVTISRYGLWIADLSVTQIMQEGIAEGERNTVFGVQNSLCQSFGVLRNVMVILLPEPSTFAICILISYVFIVTGLLCYILYLIRTRNNASVQEKGETGEEGHEMISSDMKYIDD